MKIAMKICAMLLITVMLLTSLTSCVFFKRMELTVKSVWKHVIDKEFLYIDSWIIGKNSDQIQKLYGEFDKKGKSINQDGLYYDCVCGYYTRKNENGFKLYLIYFDSDGIAYLTETEIGPKGG